MGVKRVVVQKVRPVTTTIDQICDLLSGRNKTMDFLVGEHKAFENEEARREFWKLHKGKVYAAMKNHYVKHPAAYYEYEKFTEEELQRDLPYMHPGVVLSDGRRTGWDTRTSKRNVE